MYNNNHFGEKCVSFITFNLKRHEKTVAYPNGNSPGQFAYCTGQNFQKTGEVIPSRIEEVGLNEVKYFEWEQEGPLMSIPVDQLIKVVLENGRIIEFKDPMTDPASYADQKKTAIKLNFLSPLFEYTAFSLEKSIRPGRSFETELGLIGLGFDTYKEDKSSGISLSAGYKFLRTPDFYASRMKYSHILKGSYVKPQVLLSIYSNEYEAFLVGGTTTIKDDVVSGALVINLGKQVIYDDSFLIDYSFGIGYGFSSQDFDDRDYPDWRSNQYGFFITGPDAPLVLKLNLKIGFLF